MPDRLTNLLQERVLQARSALQTKQRFDELHTGPWTVEEFLSEGRLRVGDIVLYARFGNLLSAFVKWATGSDFSHAGMIYYTPKQDEGLEHHFMIEADQNGVDLSPIKPYMQDPAVVIAILRMPDRKAWHDKQLFQEMRGRMMETISDAYDFRTIERLAIESIKTAMFGIESLVRGSRVTISSMRERKPSSLPHAFICSGLVQVGYTFACLEAIKRNEVRPETIKDTVFRNDLLDWFEPKWSNYTARGKVDQAEELYRSFVGDLEATTPADIASSENLQWQYLSIGGQVRKVSSGGEALEIMRSRTRRLINAA